MVELERTIETPREKQMRRFFAMEHAFLRRCFLDARDIDAGQMLAFVYAVGEQFGENTTEYRLLVALQTLLVHHGLYADNRSAEDRERDDLEGICD